MKFLVVPLLFTSVIAATRPSGGSPPPPRPSLGRVTSSARGGPLPPVPAPPDVSGLTSRGAGARKKSPGGQAEAPEPRVKSGSDSGGQPSPSVKKGSDAEVQPKTSETQGSSGAQQQTGVSEAGPAEYSQDSDWETREISFRRGSPSCEGHINQNTKLNLRTSNEENVLNVNGQTFEYTLQCTVDVEFISEKNNSLATFRVGFTKSNSVEENGTTPNRNIQSDKSETNITSASPLIKDGKEDKLREKAEQQLKETEGYIMEIVYDMILQAMQKHLRHSNKMMHDAEDLYGVKEENYADDQQHEEGQEHYEEDGQAYQ